jgi:K+-transporting ATPase ATPase C chain
MFSPIRPALVVLLLLSAITGGLYPLLVTGIARAAFPAEATGSLVFQNGRARGSRLIGQPFDDARYFWSRPSATAPAYNAAASSGSNLGPSNPALREAVVQRIRALRTADPENPAPIPADLVTASSSGLDPHISPAAALYQVRRVAKARQIAEGRVRALVESHIEGRAFGVLGEPVVNVLRLNLAVDELR